MPEFDFKCKNCGTIYSYMVLKGIVKDEGPRCPECGSKRARKLPATGFGIKMKMRQRHVKHPRKVFPVS